MLIPSRWLSRDPIAESGGINLYEYCFDNAIAYTDPLGQDVWVENTAAVHGLHESVCVDTWSGGGGCDACKCKKKSGKYCISFFNHRDQSPFRLVGVGIVAQDQHERTTGIKVRHAEDCKADQKVLQFFQGLLGYEATYVVGVFDCRTFVEDTYQRAVNLYGN